MIAQVYVSKALNKEFLGAFPGQKCEDLLQFFKNQLNIIKEHIEKNNLGDPLTHLIMILEYKPGNVLPSVHYSNISFKIIGFENDSNFKRFLKLVETQDNQEIKDPRFFDICVIPYSLRINKFDVYKFKTFPMYNNCSMMVSTEAVKCYKIANISKCMYDFKIALAEIFEFSAFLVTVAGERYAGLLTNYGMSEIHTVENSRTGAIVRTFVKNINKLKDDK